MKISARDGLPVVAGVAIGALACVVIAGLVGPPARDLTLHRLRAGLTVVTLVLVVWSARRAAPPWLVRAASGALCVLAVGAFYGFLSPLDSRILHRNDVFHYYMGAKYQRELGYTRIYTCTALAEAELGRADEVSRRRIRVLEDNRIARGAEVLAAGPTTCRSHFDDARWASFVADIRTFREAIPLEAWNEIQLDHGYNPPPTWALAGSALASSHPPTPGFLLLLTRADQVLVLAMAVVVAWAFGARVLAIFAVFLGCQDLGNMTWLGGTFLRLDWLFFVVLGIAGLAKRRFALGGAGLAAATALRIFPALLFAGPLVAIGAHALRTRRLTTGARRFLAGAAIASALLVGGSAAAFGPQSFGEFAAHLRVHKEQTSINNVGLPALLQHDFTGARDGGSDPSQDDPWATWRARRAARLSGFRPVQGLAIAAAVALLVASRRRPLWIAAVLSLPLVAVTLVLSCYYWIVLVVVALLTRVAPSLERVVLGSVIAAELLATMPAFSSMLDDEYTTQTAVYLVMLAWVAARLAGPRRRAAPEREEVPQKD